jgi:hypothetical protein
MKPITRLVACLPLVAVTSALAQTPSLQDVAGLGADANPTVIYTAREFITMDPKKPCAAPGTGPRSGAPAAAEAELANATLASLTRLLGQKHHH